ncbi:UNVERIFIED_CONTAM: hypothetical protein HDU68_006571 [Siphonaria sp. JEL0065]|nr:hypothetical protein HDU68_006571 [Siphonaria sp. JEL0065]
MIARKPEDLLTSPTQLQPSVNLSRQGSGVGSNFLTFSRPVAQTLVPGDTGLMVPPKPRLRGLSLSQILTNALTPSTTELAPPLPSSPVSLDIDNEPETEGPIFRTSILEAATIAGKNGIPDVVIQGVEYLERKNMLNTEGLYRVPGSAKRVKMWIQNFQEPYLNENSGSGTLSRQGSFHGRKRSSLDGEAILNMFPTIGRRRSSLNPFQLVAPTAKPDIGNLSTMAANGSHSDWKVDRPIPSNSLDIQLKSHASTISLAFEESKYGVGLWGGDGLFSVAGFPVRFDAETAATAASLLKKFFSGVKDGFIPDGFWEELDTIAIESKGEPPTEEISRKIREYIESKLPSRSHLHTFVYFILHLQRVASFADTNMMTPKNLIICVFITAKEGGEYILRYADLIFGNVDLVGRETVTSLPTEVLLAEPKDELIAKSVSNDVHEAFVNGWLTELAHPTPTLLAIPTGLNANSGGGLSPIMGSPNPSRRISAADATTPLDLSSGLQNPTLDAKQLKPQPKAFDRVQTVAVMKASQIGFEIPQQLSVKARGGSAGVLSQPNEAVIDLGCSGNIGSTQAGSTTTVATENTSKIDRNVNSLQKRVNTTRKSTESAFEAYTVKEISGSSEKSEDMEARSESNRSNNARIAVPTSDFSFSAPAPKDSEAVDSILVMTIASLTREIEELRKDFAQQMEQMRKENVELKAQLLRLEKPPGIPGGTPPKIADSRHAQNIISDSPQVTASSSSNRAKSRVRNEATYGVPNTPLSQLPRPQQQQGAFQTNTGTQLVAETQQAPQQQQAQQPQLPCQGVVGANYVKPGLSYKQKAKERSKMVSTHQDATDQMFKMVQRLETPKTHRNAAAAPINRVIREEVVYSSFYISVPFATHKKFKQNPFFYARRILQEKMGLPSTIREISFLGKKRSVAEVFIAQQDLSKAIEGAKRHSIYRDINPFESPSHKPNQSKTVQERQFIVRRAKLLAAGKADNVKPLIRLAKSNCSAFIAEQIEFAAHCFLTAKPFSYPNSVTEATFETRQHEFNAKERREQEAREKKKEEDEMEKRRKQRECEELTDSQEEGLLETEKVPTPLEEFIVVTNRRYAKKANIHNKKAAASTLFLFGKDLQPPKTKQVLVTDLEAHTQSQSQRPLPAAPHVPIITRVPRVVIQLPGTQSAGSPSESADGMEL